MPAWGWPILGALIAVVGTVVCTIFLRGLWAPTDSLKEKIKSIEKDETTAINGLREDIRAIHGALTNAVIDISGKFIEHKRDLRKSWGNELDIKINPINDTLKILQKNDERHDKELKEVNDKLYAVSSQQERIEQEIKNNTFTTQLIKPPQKDIRSCLLAEDDKDLLFILGKILEQEHGLIVTSVKSNSNAIKKLRQQAYNLIVIDWLLTDGPAVKMLEHMEKNGGIGKNVLIVSAEIKNMQNHESYEKYKNIKLLPKPIDEKHIIFNKAVSNIIGPE